MSYNPQNQKQGHPSPPDCQIQLELSAPSAAFNAVSSSLISRTLLLCGGILTRSSGVRGWALAWGRCMPLELYTKGVCVHNVYFPREESKTLIYLRMPMTPERYGLLT